MRECDYVLDGAPVIDYSLLTIVYFRHLVKYKVRLHVYFIYGGVKMGQQLLYI